MDIILIVLSWLVLGQIKHRLPMQEQLLLWLLWALLNVILIRPEASHTVLAALEGIRKLFELHYEIKADTISSSPIDQES